MLFTGSVFSFSFSSNGVVGGSSSDEQSSLLEKIKGVFAKAICNMYVLSPLFCFTFFPLIGCITYSISYKAPLAGTAMGCVLAIPTTIITLCTKACIDINRCCERKYEEII
jgi:hypothetical protein